MKKLQVKVNIKGTREQIWKVITDIENSVNVITGIEKIEILEQKGSEFVGLKWRETRTMFGQTATEVMWITDAVENESYKTRAESHGSIYITEFTLREQGSETELTMTFGAEIIALKSKIIAALTGWMFAGMTKKALKADLEDIRKAAEAF